MINFVATSSNVRTFYLSQIVLWSSSLQLFLLKTYKSEKEMFLSLWLMHFQTHLDIEGVDVKIEWAQHFHYCVLMMVDIHFILWMLEH